ncbi:MAG: DNA recombination protein RmuC [Acidobacteria bacterium]|nr:DNA recombination protein RmuC [Acidobacteriota bacterium]
MTGLEILVGALVVLMVVMLALVVRQSSELRAPRPPDPSLQLLQGQVDALRGQVNESMARMSVDLNQQIGGLKESVAARLAENVQTVQSSGRQVGESLGQALQAVSEVRQQLGRLHEASERIREVGQDVSSLKQILQAPQFRGGLGEFLLEEVLAQLFPKEFYSMQYIFESGERVDAVLHVGQGLIPIDSKFPLDSFRRLTEAAGAGSESDARQARRQFRADVRKHLDDIARKYIRPKENFYDFALMYVPAENVYYEAIIREEHGSDETGLFEYALARRVIPVSPNTLFAYLQVIALGLKGMKVEERAQRILEGLGQLDVDLKKLQTSFDKIGTQLQYAQANYADTQKRLMEFTQHLAVLSALPESSGITPALPASSKR